MSHDAVHIRPVSIYNHINKYNSRLFPTNYSDKLEPSNRICRRHFQQSGLIYRCCLFLFFYSVERPFQDYFTHIETSQSVGGRNGSTPGKPPDTPQAELGLSQMWPVRGSNLHQTQW